MKSRGQEEDDGNPEMIIVYGFLCLCSGGVGFLIGWLI